uniref:NB-ARC domain-containing protein n=1 Tax=Fagus sylvatica TaxID=28930 RepID=A0A2N9I5P1_FAGSY
MAEITVSLVKEYLVPLLVQEARLLKGIHGKVRSIKDELEIIQSFLKDADARAEIRGMSNVEKAWVKQVREEAFHTEDLVDEYILHLSKGSHGRRRRLHFIQKIFQFTIKLKARHVIASKIQDTSNNLKEKSQLAVTYRFNPTEQGGPSSGARNDTWHDPRVAALFIEEADVVGIDSPRDKLINWLVEGPSNHMVISVVGIGGLGKTTLVKKVYENDKVVAHFDSRAWITVSQSYKTEELLRDMIKQFYKARKESVPGDIDTMKETQLMEQLRLYLHEHSRILITSRNEDVAPSYHVYKLSPLPLEEAWKLFCKKVFQREGGHCPPELVEFSNGIIKRCGGLPLAIVTIGGLLSTKKKIAFEWCKFLDSLSSELESNPLLLDITKILSFSYQDLPYNLKACFLYFGMFPEDYVINCARLIRLWIAEGFVKEKQGLTLEDVAQDYLSQLIHRSLVQVAKVDFVGKTRSCRVHDMMREVILSRRSIHYIPEEVGNLFHLKYLSLRDTKVEKLPKSIGKLKNLETLDLKRSRVSKLPVEISGLSKLRYLVAYIENNDIEYNINFRPAVKIHSGIGCLQSLQKLFNIEANNDALIAELGSLGQLRKFGIYNLKRENGIALCTTLMKMSHLQSLEISATSEEEYLELQLMFSPLPLLQTLFLRGRLEKLPEWIPKLKSIVRIALVFSRLMDDPFKVLQALPNLMYLSLSNAYEGEQLHIEGGGFQKLKLLGLQELRGLNRLLIDKGSLPLLEKLQVGSRTLLKEVPSGIHHLKSLKQLDFRDMPREFVLSLQPDKGPNFWKVKHIPFVHFGYRIKGEKYKWLQMPNVSRIFKCQIRQDIALFLIYQNISG